MLIKTLYNLFCGSESQNGRLDSSIPPSEIVEKEKTAVIIPKKFKDDVERLCNYCGVELKSGLCIEIENWDKVKQIAKGKSTLIFLPVEKKHLSPLIVILTSMLAVPYFLILLSLI